MKRALVILGLGLAMVACGVSVSVPTVPPSLTLTSTPRAATELVTREPARVIRAVDGDTIAVERHGSVRIRGIDTPETKRPRTPVQCWGPQASKFANDLLTGRTVHLVFDHGDLRDRYGRYVVEVWIDRSARRVSFAELALRGGHARELTYNPRHPATNRADLLAAQIDAQRAKRGLWGAC